jgi:hypothetical protein
MKRDNETVEKMLESLLPHGSGINGTWNFQTLKNGKILASNCYDAMNEYGMYCHYYDFTAVYTFDQNDGYTLEKINFHGQKEHACCGYGLKDYLTDTLYLTARDWSEFDQN